MKRGAPANVIELYREAVRRVVADYRIEKAQGRTYNRERLRCFWAAYRAIMSV